MACDIVNKKYNFFIQSKKINLCSSVYCRTRIKNCVYESQRGYTACMCMYLMILTLTDPIMYIRTLSLHPIFFNLCSIYRLRLQKLRETTWKCW